MTLFWDKTGPALRYVGQDRTLYVSDLNPQIETQWGMSRKEMVLLGLRCIFAALKG